MPRFADRFAADHVIVGTVIDNAISALKTGSQKDSVRW